MRKIGTLIMLTVLIVSFASTLIFSQSLPKPWESQKASVSTTIGIKEISIVYSSPAVKGRKIWGELVPFGKVWRAGANENTVISFAENVKINGQDVAAGKYGLHIIPTENEWTLIFSKDYQSWGSFSYKPENDALRISVKPYQTPFEENLIYTFKNKKADAADVVLSWENLSVSFTVSLDVKRSVFNTMKEMLSNPSQATWEGFNQAAIYCLSNNFEIDQALEWANQSIKINENADNLKTKSGLLALKGNKKESDDLLKKSQSLEKKK